MSVMVSCESRSSLHTQSPVCLEAIRRGIRLQEVRNRIVVRCSVVVMSSSVSDVNTSKDHPAKHLTSAKESGTRRRSRANIAEHESYRPEMAEPRRVIQPWMREPRASLQQRFCKQDDDVNDRAFEEEIILVKLSQCRGVPRMYHDHSSSEEPDEMVPMAACTMCRGHLASHDGTFPATAKDMYD